MKTKNPQGRWIAGWAMGTSLLMATAAMAQTPSLPPGATPHWTISPPPAPPARRETASDPNAPQRVDYYDTSLTACPAGSRLGYFWYYQDNPDFRGSSWCGAAEADIAWANIETSQPTHKPVWLVSCVPGEYWTYAHGYLDAPGGNPTGQVYYSPQYRGINLACYVDPTPPPPAEPPEPAESPDSFPGPGSDPASRESPDTRGGATCQKADGLGVGNPIIPATGDKVQTETDHLGPEAHPLHWIRTYHSLWAQGSAPPPSGLGTAWRHNHAIALGTRTDTATGATQARITLGDGTVRRFSRPAGASTWTPENSADSLSGGTGDPASGYLWRRADDDSAWTFDGSGRLLNQRQRNGWTRQYSYNAAGQLIQVSNTFGRSLQITWSAAGRISGVTLPDGRQIGYTYDASGRLVSATQPDGGTRTYLYENATQTQQLTGLVAENGQRLATFDYDSQGRAIRSEHAGGAQRYTLSYGASSTDPVTVTDPLGTARHYGYAIQAGKLAVVSATAPSGTGHSDAASRVQNSLGLIDSETDFLGITTQTTWDSTRRVPLSQTRAAGHPEAQTVQTEWHATLRLPTRITEAGRITDITYDAQGNKLSETLTDTATGQRRQWQWTYDSQALVSSASDPRGGVWRYGYDSAGNRTSMVNPLGQQTRWEYDASGRVIQETAPSGLLSTYSYDARGRLLQSNRGGELSTFTYTATGRLARATLPSGHSIDYHYDTADRLVGTSDNRGHSVHYTLDAMGNRVREELRDADGALARLTTRVINALNRVAALTGAAGQTSQIGYDANGEPVSQSDPLNQTTGQSLDALRRPVATAFADGARATQAWNALDQPIQLTDPKGVTTRHQRNAFGDIVREDSPDAGSTAYEHDALGQVVRSTDARGVVTTVERDALGRPLRITRTPPAGLGIPAQESTLTWDTRQVGQLARIEDASGSVDYEHDALGRITRKTQLVLDNPAHPTSLVTRYAYGAGGQLVQLTYPSGLVVFYRRDGAGQITGIDTQISGRNKPVIPFVSSLAWNALGQPRSWSWFNGDGARRQFDADARMTANEFASYQYDAAGRIIALTQQLVAQGSGGGSAQFTAPLSWSLAYDRRGRLTGMSRAGAQSSYTWDANGNRLSAQDSASSDTDLDGEFTEADLSRTTRHSSLLDPASNRLLGFTQEITRDKGGRTLARSSTTVPYSLDATGNLISDGLRRLTYGADNRLHSVHLSQDGEEAQVRYLTNTLGQRVFVSVPQASRAAPDAGVLGEGFIAWLKASFGWLFAPPQGGASLGSALTYADGALPAWALLGQYDNGSARGQGTREFLWLPTQDGQAIPIGLVRNARLYAIHGDHLGTPRRMTGQDGQVVWQWPYSAFGANAPSGVLKATSNPRNAVTNQPLLLKASRPSVALDLRFPGQSADEASALFYNLHRDYLPLHGRYAQVDPIGLQGGWNPFGYGEGNPLSYTDPMGLQARPWRPPGAPIPGLPGPRPVDPSEPGGPTYTPVPKWPSLPDWTTKKSDSAELEQCKQDADDALDRAYDYCKALGATYNDYRTRKACEENAFRKYTKRLQECEQQCK